MDSHLLKITLHPYRIYLNGRRYIPVGYLANLGTTINSFNSREGLVKYISETRKVYLAFTHRESNRELILL